MSAFGQGLTLSGIGIGITFSALGILILIILGLKILFPAGIDQPEEKEGRKDRPGQDSRSREDLRCKAAAVGVAVLRSRGSVRRGGSLGSRLESPPGEWWRKGLERAQGKETT